MIEYGEDEVFEFYQPLPAWLFEPLTSGTFSNGMSKVGYLPTEAWETELAIRAARQERGEHV